MQVSRYTGKERYSGEVESEGVRPGKGLENKNMQFGGGSRSSYITVNRGQSRDCPRFTVTF